MSRVRKKILNKKNVVLVLVKHCLGFGDVCGGEPQKSDNFSISIHPPVIIVIKPQGLLWALQVKRHLSVFSFGKCQSERLYFLFVGINYF